MLVLKLSAIQNKRIGKYLDWFALELWKLDNN
jgi:hypothetical protein